MAGIKNDRISCSTACGTAHIRLHIHEADMHRPLRISARGDTQPGYTTYCAFPQAGTGTKIITKYPLAEMQYFFCITASGIVGAR